MARKRPDDRFEHLVEAATRAFIANGGFKRTSIDDVARELGVAKGTVYLYVQSKEALFDVCLRRADAPASFPEPSLPVPTPEPEATFDYVRSLIGDSSLFGALDEVLSGESGLAPRAELERLVDELYRTLFEHRVKLRLINASASDLPELGELWYGAARGGLNRRLAGWLSRRSTAGDFRPMPDPACAARLLSETVYWFAVNRTFDPGPDRLDDGFAKETVKASLLRTFLPCEHAA
ncbi:MAG: TetR/AcrR family transcriptional regulator [Sandaracinaceae bacterium]|nr:TetR/AcrR family transcriptional regulator [Sandaracinaceae bacterium]